MTETGYDLAVLSRPAGEARFANVRKMARLATEFEAREGRDLRGFLDFLAARAESDAEAQAATAAEGHDGVRIMTVHNAKGLEFGVVAVPDLARSLLAGGRAPLLTLGREEQPRVGLQLRRLGAPSINLFDHRALCEEAKERDAEEGLRLFHVAATRAKRRLILSGVVKPDPGKETKPSTPVIERLVDALGVPRDADSTVPVAPPAPRPGLEAEFEPSEIAVRVEPPLARARSRAADPAPRGRRRERRSAAARRPWSSGARRSSPAAPSPTPQSPPTRSAPTASTWSACWGSQRSEPDFSPDTGDKTPMIRTRAPRAGAAVHALLEWSQANGWAEPTKSWRSGTLRRLGLGRSRETPDRPARVARGVARSLSASWTGLPAAGNGLRRRGDASSGRGAVAAWGR